MDHTYNYYKKLPRDEIVGGFFEFSGGADDLDDIDVDDEKSIRAEIYGSGGDRGGDGGAAARSASTIDDGILKLFGDDHARVDLKQSKARSEDAKTAEFGPKAPKRRRKSKKGGVPMTPEEFSL